VSQPSAENDPQRRRNAPLMWVSAAVATAVLVLGIWSTLDYWSAAIGGDHGNHDSDQGTPDEGDSLFPPGRARPHVGHDQWSDDGSDDQNSDNESISSISLQETGPDAVGNLTICTTANKPDNRAQCSINKYGANGALRLGRNGTAVRPGESVSTTVTITNTGASDAASLTLTPGPCIATYWATARASQHPAAADNVCGRVRVTVVCAGSAALEVASTSLSAFAASGPRSFSRGLPHGGSTSCKFTVTVPADTPSRFSGQTVDQALDWRLAL
jgi:hypothetical protein